MILTMAMKWSECGGDMVMQGSLIVLLIIPISDANLQPVLEEKVDKRTNIFF